jgi:hypothetical protein
VFLFLSLKREEKQQRRRREEKKGRVSETKILYDIVPSIEREGG